MDGKDEILQIDSRRKIFLFIKKNPGLHEREISRQMNIPLGTLDYHLHFLEKRDLIKTRSDGHYTRYFISGEISLQAEILLKILRQKTPRKILVFLLESKHAFHRDIQNHLGLAASTVSFHLNKMVELGVIKKVVIGRESIFSVISPDKVIDLLITYKKSFIDSAVDNFVDTWLELNPSHIKKNKEE